MFALAESSSNEKKVLRLGIGDAVLLTRAVLGDSTQGEWGLRQAVSYRPGVQPREGV